MKEFLMYIYLQVFSNMVRHTTVIKLADLKHILLSAYDELIFLKYSVSGDDDEKFYIQV